MADTKFDSADIQSGSPARGAATADLLLADIASDWVRYKRRRRIGTWIFRFIVIALLLAIATALIIPLTNRESVSDEPYTATISLKGGVFEEGEASAESLRWRLTEALEDEQSAGVLLLIDSPGGSPVEAGLMYDDIQRLRKEHPNKPVHAVVGDLAASAGYYIAAAADNIYANKASLIGSIGVRLDAFGAVDAIERLGLERRLITAGEHKGLLDPFLPVDEVGQAHLQGVLDSTHQQFIDAVKEGRGERLSNDPTLFTGLIWNGEQAVELGLIDGLKDRYAVAKDVIGAEEMRAYRPEQTLIDRLSEEIGAVLQDSLRPRIGWQ
ncbi:MAG: S49 family peptidase [Granulosicoccus sp.]